MVKRITLTLLAVLTLTVAGFPQKSSKSKTPPQGTPILWREPANIQSRDVFAGPGGNERPNLSRVTFIKDQAAGGYSTNYRVRDASGRIWIAKLGKEAQPETAAVRLAWAIGYVTEINYLVPCVHIMGAPDNRRQFKRCEGNGFANVKFEARPQQVKRIDKWSWASNPFSGTREFKGLIVLMSFLNNWDLKDDNNRILFVPGTSGQNELHYIISDLGATFGKTGGVFSRSRNDPEDYVKAKFVEGVEGNHVKLAYSGKNTALFKDITVDDAKWLGNLLARLRDDQISAAFRAANYTPEQVQMLTGAVRQRIEQLVNLGG